MGYAKLYKAEKKQEYLEKIDFLLGLLDKCKSKGYSGNSWDITSTGNPGRFMSRNIHQPLSIPLS